jgi:hypothetical protein
VRPEVARNIRCVINTILTLHRIWDTEHMRNAFPVTLVEIINLQISTTQHFVRILCSKWSEEDTGMDMERLKTNRTCFQHLFQNIFNVFRRTLQIMAGNIICF